MKCANATVKTRRLHSKGTHRSRLWQARRRQHATGTELKRRSRRLLRGGCVIRDVSWHKCASGCAAAASATGQERERRPRLRRLLRQRRGMGLCVGARLNAFAFALFDVEVFERAKAVHAEVDRRRRFAVAHERVSAARRAVVALHQQLRFVLLVRRGIVMRVVHDRSEFRRNVHSFSNLNWCASLGKQPTTHTQ